MKRRLSAAEQRYPTRRTKPSTNSAKPSSNQSYTYRPGSVHLGSKNFHDVAVIKNLKFRYLSPYMNSDL